MQARSELSCVVRVSPARLLHWPCWQGLAGTSAAACVCCRGTFLGNGRVVHRLAIFDAHGCITCIVSQLDIMR